MGVLDQQAYTVPACPDSVHIAEVDHTLLHGLTLQRHSVFHGILHPSAAHAICAFVCPCLVSLVVQADWHAPCYAAYPTVCFSKKAPVVSVVNVLFSSM